ncbi:SMI1/KNR4 family protein [Saccharothrix variisporea]|uniref:SMI1/KNR4 family protein SUKH-1 n=1 Tax=Saccharothrix variisporea TaxID=543527 RepID=A0A495X3J1_9PSEU|nr:SMI1/KNR4 family protein [Saccharothrix variisporea]RKT68520.1 SMI1/KNR4 family protein SUKH-1 [Saccharothrix variisporea]
MWVEMMSALLPDARFFPPAEEARLGEVAEQLDAPLPNDLLSLLAETNGVQGAFLVDVVWSVDRILSDNRDFRTRSEFAGLYEGFEGLLFFGDNGGGDQFAFLSDGRPGVLVWQHEDDERRVVASDLAEYLNRALTSGGEDWYRDE